MEGGRALWRSALGRTARFFRFIKSNEFGSRAKTMDKKTKPDTGTSGCISDLLETQKNNGTISKHNQQL